MSFNDYTLNVLVKFKSSPNDDFGVYGPIEYFRKMTLYFMAILMWAFAVRFLVEVIGDPRSISMVVMFLIDGILFFEWGRTEHGDKAIHFGGSVYSKGDAILLVPIMAAALAFVIVVVMS